MKRRYVEDIPVIRRENHSFTKEDFTKYTPAIRNDDAKGLSFWTDIERGSDLEGESPTHFLLIVLAICLLSIGGWFTYRWLFPVTPDILPVLRPESQTYRIRPDNPGGIAVPYQDTMVYNHDRRQGETLMPPQELYYAQQQKAQQEAREREKMQQRDHVPPQQNPAPPSYAPSSPEQYPREPNIGHPQPHHPHQDMMQAASSVREQTVQPLAPVPEHVSQQEMPPLEHTVVSPASQHPSARVPPRTPEEVVSSFEEDVFQIQVGFFKSTRIAARELSRLKKRHGRLLSDYDLDLQTVGQGRTRILIGPFYSKTQALSIAMRLGHRSRVIKEAG